jgi:tetratricopeptide (TPR) repeat protein
MTRDNLLFVTLGLLAGFISGYFTHEVMAVRQPPSLAVLQAAQAAALGGAHADGADGGNVPAGAAAGDPGGTGGGPVGAAGPAGAGGPGGPPMAEVLRLREQVEKNPNDAEAVLTLANLNYDIRNWERARELYEHYLTLRPPQPDVLTDLGVSLRGLKRFPEAMARFEEAQRLQDGHWQSLYNEVVVLAFDLKEMDKAQQVLARLRQLQPDNDVVTNLAEEVARRSGSA